MKFPWTKAMLMNHPIFHEKYMHFDDAIDIQLYFEGRGLNHLQTALYSGGLVFEKIESSNYGKVGSSLTIQLEISIIRCP